MVAARTPPVDELRDRPHLRVGEQWISISADGLGDAVRSPITWGVLFGLLVGKPLGVVLATRVTIRSGLGEYPDGAEPRQIVGIGAAAGIGFTVALFITELAFTDPVDQSNAKLAILVASVLAAAGSSAILTLRPRA